MEHNLNGIDPQTAQMLTSQIRDMIDRSKFENVEIEMIPITVAAGATTYSTSHFTSLRHKRVVGVALSTTDEAHIEGATFSLLIDSKEIFPSGCEAKLLFASTAVPPNQKFYTYVDMPVNQTKVDFSFTSNVAPTGYTVTIYLLCQNV